MQRSVWILLFPLISQSALANNHNEKQLVLFAGPFRSGATSVEKFFHNHASGGNEASQGLNGWLWPSMPDGLPGPPHRVFDNLVIHQNNETLQEILMQGIHKAWNNAGHGVVLGSASFDRTRKGAPDSPGLLAMTKIVQKLGVSKDKVTIALNYRAPRLDQWVSVWKNTWFEEKQISYNDYVCTESTHPSWAEHQLMTAMNPFGLAQVYRDQGWKVVMLDMEGVLESGLDMAHVIACNVLAHTNCQNGWVVDKVGTTYQENYEKDKDFGILSDAEKQSLEEMFQDRDCFYEHALENDGGFSVLYTEAIWQGCEQGKQEYYKKLTEHDYMLNEIKAQVGCGELTATAAPANVTSKSNQPDAESPVNTLQLTWVFLCAVGIFAIFKLLCCMRKYKYVMSPKSYGEPEWFDFEDDGTFQEVDLDAPGASSRDKLPQTPEMITAIREGHSVRGLYGLTPNRLQFHQYLDAQHNDDLEPAITGFV
jgi:hypothetical protein